jgi:hypothetical protein
MLTHNDLRNIRDEYEAENTWRKYSRHVIADLLEGCAMCGTSHHFPRFVASFGWLVRQDSDSFAAAWGISL